MIDVHGMILTDDRYGIACDVTDDGMGMYIWLGRVGLVKRRLWMNAQ
jgi:hypothetical protein